MIKVGLFLRDKSNHSHKWLMAFNQGLIKHGIKATVYTLGDRPRDINLAVFWSGHNLPLIHHCKYFNIDYLIMEHGYVGNRQEWTSCGFNGLNGLADFILDNIDDKRIGNILPYVKPYKKRKVGSIIIMGQVPSDASVKEIGFNLWLENTAGQIERLTNRKCYYRPHPLYKEPFIPKNLEVIGGSLQDALDKAYTVVTLNSNSGVDAILEGIPTIACHKGSMVYNIASNKVDDANTPIFDDEKRQEWVKKISYCQWTEQEIIDGITWEHLKQKYN